MLEFLVDTGSDVTINNNKTVQKLSVEKRLARRLFRGADGNILEIKYTTEIPLLTSWGQNISSKVCILEGATNILLGKATDLDF